MKTRKIQRFLLLCPLLQSSAGYGTVFRKEAVSLDNINKTLYIPLCGKAFVSKRGILLHDPMAEAIWEQQGFPLKGTAKSKWLAYYMGMRAAVFDRWLVARLEEAPETLVIQIGCGLDSRVHRLGVRGHLWYDVDFPEVIRERRRYYAESDHYHMLGADARECPWLHEMPLGRNTLVVLEGVSMYFRREELLPLLAALTERFSGVSVLMDCYTVFAARASKYKNPINEVGVTQLYGVDRPEELEAGTGLVFIGERELTPGWMTDQLAGFDRAFFRAVFTGASAKKIYRLFEYEKK